MNTSIKYGNHKAPILFETDIAPVTQPIKQFNWKNVSIRLFGVEIKGITSITFNIGDRYDNND